MNCYWQNSNNRPYSLLAFCARPGGDAAYFDQLAEAAGSIEDWQGLIVEAEEHGLGPLLYVHLEAADVSLPPDIKRGLQGLYLRHQHANRVRGQVLAEILAAYRAAGIRVLILKGAALAHLIYSNPGLRPMRDLDLLVEVSEARRAQEVLVGLGFGAPLPTGPTLPGKHLASAVRQEEGFVVSVDVHHNLFHDDGPLSLDLAGLATVPLAFDLPQGTTVYTLGYEEMLWHLCCHTANIARPLRLIWVADIVGFAERFAADINWSLVRQVYPPILDTLSLFHYLTPLPDPLRQNVRSGVGSAPRGIGVEFQGWPRFSLRQQRSKSYWQIFYDSFFPSEWWLRLYSGVGPGRTLFWQRWVWHPLRIFGFLKRRFLG
jgi:hypothetical protein